MDITHLNLETVTPMFLHGHDNKIVELRPPPFKALFRYWWRTVQDCDTDSLRKNEAKLFGSTDGKAPFSIRISGTTDLGVPKKYSPLPHKNTFPTEAYDAGKSFNLLLIAKNTSDASNYKQIAKLGFLLGGVGNRSRRGFGSIRETGWNFSDVSSLRDEVLKTLNDVAEGDRFQINNFRIKDRTVTTIESKKRTHHPPEYPVIQRVFFGELTKGLGNLLVKIGQATHDAKLRNRDDTLGGGNPRMASPVIVSIQMIGTQYLPVVTQLWSPYPNNRPTHNFQQKQEQFIDAIIGDSHE